MSAIRTRLAAAALAVGLGLGAGSTLSACGSVQRAGAAAIVDGTVISQADLDTTMSELQGAKIEADARNVLTLVIFSGPVLAQVGKTGSWRPDGQYNDFMAAFTNPSPTTIAAARTSFAFPTMSDEDRTAVIAALETMAIEVDPRFGEFNVQNGVVAAQPAWLQQAPTDNPTTGNEPGPTDTPSPTAPATP